MPRSRERLQKKKKVKDKMTVLAFKQGLIVIQLHMHFGGRRQKVMSVMMIVMIITKK